MAAVDFSSQDLFDELAMCSEPLLDEFMESGELVDAHIAQAVAQREVFPCFYGSALKLDRWIRCFRAFAVYV